MLFRFFQREGAPLHMAQLKKWMCLVLALSLVGCGDGNTVTSDAQSNSSTTSSQGTQSETASGEARGDFVIPDTSSYDEAAQVYTVPFQEGEEKFAVTFTLSGTHLTGWFTGNLVVQIWGSDGFQLQKIEQNDMKLYYGADNKFEPSTFFWVKDLTFDGATDIAFIKSADERDQFFRGLLWDDSSSFFRESNFDEICNPVVEESDKRISGSQLQGEYKGSMSSWAYTDNAYQKVALLNWEPVLGEKGVEQITDTRWSNGTSTVAFQTALRTDEDGQKFTSYFATSTQWTSRFNSEGFLAYFLGTAKSASSEAASSNTTTSRPSNTSSTPSLLQGRP